MIEDSRNNSTTAEVLSVDAMSVRGALLDTKALSGQHPSPAILPGVLPAKAPASEEDRCMEESLITPEAKAMIGQPVERQTGVVHAKEAQRFAAAVGDSNPLYFDDEVARAQGYRGVVAPPMFLPQVLQGVTRLESLREDGIPFQGGSDIPLRADRLMAGGEEYEFHSAFYPGDTITAETRIQNIEEKSGRSGRFVLITRETLYTNQDGVVVAKGRFSLIAR
jgi:acyl dehydratase